MGNGYCALNRARALNLFITYNIMNVGTDPPIGGGGKNGHNFGKNIGTKTWGKLEFQFASKVDKIVLTCFKRYILLHLQHRNLYIWNKTPMRHVSQIN